MPRLKRPLSIYLAGAIRDGVTEDIVWRQRVISSLPDVCILNPLAGKTFHQTTQVWTVAGVPATTRTIVKQDGHCVDAADIVLANMTSLTEKYPSIGSLIELGRAWGKGKLIYIILPAGYSGHQNNAMFKLHPFLEEISAGNFLTVDGAIDFLRRYTRVLTGEEPEFDGVV